MIEKLSRLSAALSSVVLLIAIAHILLHIFMRSVLGSPPLGTNEIVTFVWLPVLVFLALPGAYVAGEHLRATIVVDSLDGVWRNILNSVSFIAFASTTGILAYFLILGAWDSYSIGEANTRGGITVPIWPSRFASAIGFILLVTQIVSSAARNLFTKTSGETDDIHTTVGKL